MMHNYHQQLGNFTLHLCDELLEEAWDKNKLTSKSLENIRKINYQNNLFILLRRAKKPSKEIKHSSEILLIIFDDKRRKPKIRIVGVFENYTAEKPKPEENFARNLFNMLRENENPPESRNESG